MYTVRFCEFISGLEFPLNWRKIHKLSLCSAHNSNFSVCRAMINQSDLKLVNLNSVQYRVLALITYVYYILRFLGNLHFQRLEIWWNNGEAISLWKGNVWSCFPTLVLSNNRLFLSSPWKHYLIFLPFPLKTYRARKL